MLDPSWAQVERKLGQVGAKWPDLKAKDGQVWPRQLLVGPSRLASFLSILFPGRGRLVAKRLEYSDSQQMRRRRLDYQRTKMFQSASRRQAAQGYPSHLDWWCRVASTGNTAWVKMWKWTTLGKGNRLVPSDPCRGPVSPWRERVLCSQILLPRQAHPNHHPDHYSLVICPLKKLWKNSYRL